MFSSKELDDCNLQLQRVTCDLAHDMCSSTEDHSKLKSLPQLSVLFRAATEVTKTSSLASGTFILTPTPHATRSRLLFSSPQSIVPATISSSLSSTHSGTDLPPCQYHSGAPIFHEGLQFSLGTTEFTEFSKQPGCTTGEHVWKPTREETAAMMCR